MTEKRRLWRLLWWLYLVILIVFVVIKFSSFAELSARIARASETVNYNLIPFHTLSIVFRLVHSPWAIYNLLGNFIPFVPFGILLPLAYSRLNTVLRIFAVGLISIICIELFQLVTRVGSFDVDDILLNMVGILCGYLFLRIFCRLTRPK